MTPTQHQNFLSSIETFRRHYHEQLDILCNQMVAIITNADMMSELPKPMNDLAKDPARQDYTRRNFKRNAIKMKVCPICGRELPLGQFRSSDNHLHNECNACRDERDKEIKDKRKNKKAP